MAEENIKLTKTIYSAQSIDGLVDRFGWDFLQDDPEAWRKRYPKVTKKVDELEARIKKLEGK